MNTRLFIACLLASSLLGCGESSPEENGAQEADIEGLDSALVETQCERIFSCCDAADFERVFPGDGVDTEEDCRDVVGSYTRVFLLPSLQSSVDAGRIAFRNDGIDACVRAIGAQSCAEFEPTANVDVFAIPACSSLVEPKLELSGFCTEDFECTTGFCSRPSGAAEGACKEAPDADEPCLNERCGEGLFCDSQQICRPRVAVGQPCSRNEECASEVCSSSEGGDSSCISAPVICNE